MFSLLGNRIAWSSRLAGAYVYGGKLKVGARCFVGRGAYFDLTEAVTIMDDVVIGHGVTFVTANHKIGSADRRCGDVVASPIVIHRGAWIGANATIMPGVTISSGAVVAAGALVLRNVDSNTLVGGVPAKLIRLLD